MMKNYFVILVIPLAIIACSSDKTMRERFADDRMKILSDSEGNKYAVQHHIGNSYTVKPLADADCKVKP